LNNAAIKEALNSGSIIVVESNGDNISKPQSTEVTLSEDGNTLSNSTSAFANLIPESRISSGYGDFSVNDDWSGGIILGCVITTVLFTAICISYRYFRNNQAKQEIDSHIIGTKLRATKKAD
jgi:hypothetical protein